MIVVKRSEVLCETHNHFCSVTIKKYELGSKNNEAEYSIMEVGNNLYIGFKGQNNSSYMLVSRLSRQCCFLTNSFNGIKKDIDMLPADYDTVYLFGSDKNLTDSFRIEQCADKDGIRLFTALDLEDISGYLSDVGIKSEISNRPTHYLCNEAYWYLLEKYHGKVVLIHIPTMKNCYNFFDRMIGLPDNGK